MGYTYTPTYYTSLHDSITSICKNILPFSFKKKRLPAIAAAEQRLSKQQSDNLKWQQESFHQILNLMGLCKEGILAETQVSAFRTHLLETLIAAPLDYEPSLILRDKLIFLQELLYANCISDDEYHASKRPLLQRLAVQGAEIEASDLIVGLKKDPSSNEEWSVIDLKEDKSLVNPKIIALKNKSKENSAKRKLKGAASVLDFVSPNKYGKLKEKDMNGLGNDKFGAMDLYLSTNGIQGNELARSVENPFWNSGLSENEYHASKRPLLQRLAVQGAEIEASDLIVGLKKDPSSNEEWSVIDLKEDKSLVNPKIIALKNKSKENSAKRKLKGAASVLDFVSPNKYGKLKEKDMNGLGNDKFGAMDLYLSTNGIQGNELARSVENPFWNSGLSENEYHASKRPLLQRLAVQGAEIEASDLIVGLKKDPSSNEEWSVIDLKEDKSLVNPKIIALKNKSKENSAKRKLKGAASVLDFVSPNKYGKLKEKDMNGLGNDKFGAMDLYLSTNGIQGNELARSVENPFWNSGLSENESESRSILMMESSPVCSIAEKQNGGEKKEKGKSAKKTWGFDGFKKWKKNESDDETVPLSLTEKSDGGNYGGTLVANPFGEGPDTKQMKRKLHPTGGAPLDFFVDKVLRDNIKKELSHIQTELGAKNPHIQLSDVQIEAVSTRFPADKADLNKFFPKSWCDRRHGELVLDVVKKEFKNHVEDMGNSRDIAREKNKNNSKRWTTFDDHEDQENSHPNLFAPQQDNSSYFMKQTSFSASKNIRTSFNSSIDKGFKYNPFFDM